MKTCKPWKQALEKRLADETPAQQAARTLPLAALLKEEQIQAPENASIARFDGIGCYQSSSKTAKQAASRPGQTRRWKMPCAPMLIFGFNA